jgi:hypothetical protein
VGLGSQEAVDIRAERTGWDIVAVLEYMGAGRRRQEVPNMLAVVGMTVGKMLQVVHKALA